MNQKFSLFALLVALFVLFIRPVQPTQADDGSHDWQIAWQLDKGDVPNSPYYGVYTVYGEGNNPDGAWGVTRGESSNGCFVWFVNSSLTTMDDGQPYRMLALFTAAFLNGHRPDANPLFDNAIPTGQRDEYIQWLAETGMRLGPLCPDEPPYIAAYTSYMPVAVR